MTDGTTTGRQLPDRVVVGRAHGPHGIRGEVSVEVLTDVEQRFAPGSRLTAVDPKGRERSLEVAASRRHKGGLLVLFAGIEDRDAAAAVKGSTLEVARSEVPPAPKGTYYFYELVGCRVHDAHEGDLGEVTDVVEDGGGLLLVVSGPEGTVPIPFVKSFLRSVDVKEGRIDLELPPGLVDICASRS